MKKIILTTIAAAVVGAIGAQGGDIKAVYERDCAKCHGADGKGDTKMGKKSGAKDYTDAKVQAELKDDKAFKSIKEGLKEGDKVLMKPAEKVSDDEIKGLIAYMRTFKKG